MLLLHLGSDLSRTMPALLLYLLPLSSQIWRNESGARDWRWKSQQDQCPSRTVSVIYSTYRTHPTAFLNKHKVGKKPKAKTKVGRKKPKQILSPSATHTTHGLALSCTSVSSKANWERWMKLFIVEITRAELSCPSLLPLLWHLKFVHLHKTDRPHLSGLFRATRKEETFPLQKKPFCTAWGNLYWAAYR